MNKKEDLNNMVILNRLETEKVACLIRLASLKFEMEIAQLEMKEPSPAINERINILKATDEFYCNLEKKFKI